MNEKRFSAMTAVICVLALPVSSASVMAQEKKDIPEEQTKTEDSSEMSLGDLLNLDINLISVTGTLKTVRQAPAGLLTLYIVCRTFFMRILYCRNSRLLTEFN
ncbi:MAG: hypothetical protein GY749_23375 [Desulfobacteraceae bacterium]|nr:hypothetical protein [Desulfobacteraceae bacterium]